MAGDHRHGSGALGAPFPEQRQRRLEAVGTAPLHGGVQLLGELLDLEAPASCERARLDRAVRLLAVPLSEPRIGPEEALPVALRIRQVEREAVISAREAAERLRPHAVQEAEVHGLRELAGAFPFRRVVGVAPEECLGRECVEVRAGLERFEHAPVAGDFSREAEFDLAVVGFDEHAPVRRTHAGAVARVARQVLKVRLPARHPPRGGPQLLPVREEPPVPQAHRPAGAVGARALRHSAIPAQHFGEGVVQSGERLVVGTQQRLAESEFERTLRLCWRVPVPAQPEGEPGGRGREAVEVGPEPVPVAFGFTGEFLPGLGVEGDAGAAQPHDRRERAVFDLRDAPEPGLLGLRLQTIQQGEQHGRVARCVV